MQRKRVRAWKMTIISSKEWTFCSNSLESPNCGCGNIQNIQHAENGSMWNTLKMIEGIGGSTINIKPPKLHSPKTQIYFLPHSNSADKNTHLQRLRYERSPFHPSSPSKIEIILVIKECGYSKWQLLLVHDTAQLH